VKSIIDEIAGDVFCILVDESADISGKEQVAIVLRYVICILAGETYCYCSCARDISFMS
jgi:hypothetical protein